MDRARVYDFVPESTLLVMEAGFTVGEIPITFAEHQRGESKLGMTEVIKGVPSKEAAFSGACPPIYPRRTDPSPSPPLEWLIGWNRPCT